MEKSNSKQSVQVIPLQLNNVSNKQFQLIQAGIYNSVAITSNKEIYQWGYDLKDHDHNVWEKEEINESYLYKQESIPVMKNWFKQLEKDYV